MLILSLAYVKPLEEVDRHIEPHMEWVRSGYDRGWFLASGRKEPRNGGVILAKGDRAEIEDYVAADPFVLAGVALYDIVEVHVTRTADGLEDLKN